MQSSVLICSIGLEVSRHWAPAGPGLLNPQREAAKPERPVQDVGTGEEAGGVDVRFKSRRKRKKGLDVGHLQSVWKAALGQVSERPQMEPPFAIAIAGANASRTVELQSVGLRFLAVWA